MNESMETYSKRDTIDAMAEETGFTKKDLEVMYNALANVILDTARDHNKFFMRGILSITPYVRKATQRRNPQNGQIVDVPEKPALRIRPGRLLREAVEG